MPLFPEVRISRELWICTPYSSILSQKAEWVHNTGTVLPKASNEQLPVSELECSSSPRPIRLRAIGSSEPAANLSRVCAPTPSRRPGRNRGVDQKESYQIMGREPAQGGRDLT